MSTNSTHEATETPAPRRSPPRRRIASGELLFVRLETPRTLPAYPSFRNRLAATDTWNNHNSGEALSPAASSPRYSTSPWHPDSEFSFDRADSIASTSYSNTSLASSTTSKRRHSTSSSDTLSWREKQARQSAAAEAVREAVSKGTLDANSYTDGQLYSIKAEAEKHSTAPARDEGGGSHKGKKRRRTSGLEGREGQIAHAVKIRRLEEPPHNEADSEDGSAERVEEVEVDLTKLLGM